VFPEYFLWLFTVFAFLLGACIGSFLNVAIYRMPLGLSVNKPRRSFCPHCNYMIPWYRNLPLVSWLMLRGKCANCSAPIAFRYFGVEFLTACLFLAVWLTQPWELALPLWILLGLLIVATFIDFDYFIIPDEITIGGTVIGLVCAFVFPGLMDVDSRWYALLFSACGAALGFGVLWAISFFGKVAFGRKKMAFDPPQQFEWKREGDHAVVTLGEESMPWDELFTNEKDVLTLECVELEMGELKVTELTVRSRYEQITVQEKEYDLNAVERFSARIRAMQFKRDAMGFGDVKFIACIGAFLGWQAVLLTIIVASITGAAIGLAALITGQRDRSSKIPFGPYLALGALVWIFAGPQLVAWYFNFLRPPDEFGF